MKTVYQLAKLARRVGYQRRLAIRVLTQGRRNGSNLTPSQSCFFQSKLDSLRVLQQGLKDTLTSRRVGSKPYRDATPHRLRTKPFPRPDFGDTAVLRSPLATP